MHYENPESTMPNYSKPPAAGRDKKPFKAADRNGSKPGSRSEGHRGFHGDAPVAKKRWSTDDRAARTGDRAASTDRRPNWTPAEKPAKPAYGDRTERPAYGDRNARTERPAYGDRPQRTERPAYGDRPQRSNDRPAYNNDRPARPAYGDRPARSNDDRPARPAYNDRPARSYDERPARTERPAYNNDRPARPAYNNDRPARSYDDRPARREYSNDRPQRSNSDRPSGTRPAGRSDWNSATPRTQAHEQHVDVVHERLQAEAIQATDVDGVSFGSLGLGENIVRVLAELGAAAPFAIQAATIPEILAGRDVLARGRTGSGKTIAFGAPLVENVLRAGAGKKREFGRKPKAIILAPTRELALQIDRTIQPIARSVGLFTTQIYGGVPQARQVGALKKGVDIIIGTPGRIEDLITQRKLDLSEVMVAVIDEADHMCELGFLEPVQRILRETADGSQKLLFSATLDREVSALVDEFLVNPSVHEVAGEDQASSTIDHRILVIEHRDKAQILDQLVDREGKTLVFARTRAYAEMLAEQFADVGIPAVSLHGDLNQARRTRNLERLTSGRVNVLVATDVAARGIHVDDIDLVIQADAPDEYKTYLHRSGRTGRAGKTGRVVTLITRQRQRKMAEMLERAEIDAPYQNVRPGDDTIEELTGRMPTAAELTA